MAALEEIKNEVLQFLFKSYLENGGTPIFDLSEIAHKHNIPPDELGRYLVSKHLVKNERFNPNGFAASISNYGIDMISPNYFSGNTEKVLAALSQNGNSWAGIFEILGTKAEDYQLAFDIAKKMEGQGLIEAQYRHNNVIIKMTLDGRGHYESNKDN